MNEKYMDKLENENRKLKAQVEKERSDICCYLLDIRDLKARNEELKRVVNAIDVNNRVHLLSIANQLKQTSGEGWSVGVLVERALAALEKKVGDDV